MRPNPNRRQIGAPCGYCLEPMTRSGKRQATRDHAFPKHQGHRLSDFNGLNRVFVCSNCNSSKKHHDIVEWWWRLDRGNDPRAQIVLKIIWRFWTAGLLPNIQSKQYAAALATLNAPMAELVDAQDLKSCLLAGSTPAGRTTFT